MTVNKTKAFMFSRLTTEYIDATPERQAEIDKQFAALLDD